MTDRIPPVMLDPTGGSTNFVPKIQVDGTVAWAEGGGTGGVGVFRTIAQPHGSMLRRYDFTANITGWTASAGTLAHDATNGRLQHTAGVTGTSIVILEPTSAANVADGEFYADFSEETLATTQVHTGLFFRATDADNLYMLSVGLAGSTGTVELFKRVAGTYTSLGGGSVAVGRYPLTGPQRHRLMVRFVGQHIKAFVNETPVGVWNDSTHTTGRCGVRHLAQNSVSQVASWDNASVYSLPSGWTFPAYSIDGTPYAPPAADIAYAGSTNLAATNVEAALDELDAEKAGVGHTHVKANITDLGTIGTAAALNVPASGDAAAGEVVKGSDTRLTNARTPTAHTHISAGATAFSTVATSIPSATWTIVPLPSESFDSDGFHDTVTNNHRLAVPTGLGGVYVITGSPAYSSGFASSRSAALMVNGQSVIETASDDSRAYSIALAYVTRLSAGDLIHMLTRQESGVAQTLATSGNTKLSMFRIGD